MSDVEKALADYRKRVWGVTKRFLQAHDRLDLSDMMGELERMCMEELERMCMEFRDVSSPGSDEDE